MKLELSAVNEELGERPEVFICTASFEERCRSVADRLDTSKLESAVVLWNSDYLGQVKDNLTALESRFAGRVKKVELKTDEPLSAADTLREQVLPIVKSCAGLCLVDITTFTHEQLLILVKLLTELDPAPRIKFAYTGAADYSTNHIGSNKWLSRGVSSIRTVLGYPGIMLPSRKLHLIILVGFESERAEKLISISEPALLTLGRGRQAQSVTDEHHGTNVIFHERVRLFSEEVSTLVEGVQWFEFSAVDPAEAMKDILKEVDRSSEYNIAVCPLNTKPSTVGAALAALYQDRIQLVYAQPVEYNTEGYSRPGTHFTLFDFNQLLSSLGNGN